MVPDNGAVFFSSTRKSPWAAAADAGETAGTWGSSRGEGEDTAEGPSGTAAIGEDVQAQTASRLHAAAKKMPHGLFPKPTRRSHVAADIRSLSVMVVSIGSARMV
jgi:hypothetical protein